MDEARRVIERLERIERLRAGGGSRLVLLSEVRHLLAEGERWLEAEPSGTERARALVDETRRRLGPTEEVVPGRA